MTRQGMTFVEITVAVGILGACMLPVVNLVHSTLRESAASREEIFAHQLLSDLVERYKDSPLSELSQLPSPSLPVGSATGVDDEAVKDDPVLKAQRERMSNVDGEPARASGFAAYRDLWMAMKPSRWACFQKDAQGPGRHLLVATVRFIAAGRVRQIQATKLVIR